MNLTLNSDIQQFIDEQVRSGRFPTVEAVVEAAVATLRDLDSELDDDTVAAINEAEEQADRGEGIELDAFRAKVAERLARP